MLTCHNFQGWVYYYLEDMTTGFSKESVILLVIGLDTYMLFCLETLPAYTSACSVNHCQKLTSLVYFPYINCSLIKLGQNHAKDKRANLLNIIH